jgi:GT2 family glycosyltransferase
MDLAKPEELSAPVAMASLPAAEAYQAWHARTRAGVAELERQRQEAASWQNAPLLSVVIPSYNSRPGWFAELIDSLRGQTYPRFECLIVDDASTQKSHLDRAGSAAREDPRFRVIEHRENLGVGGATRTGADASIGDYVLVVDHDDVLEPDALFEIAGAIRGGGADVVYTDEVLVSEAGSVFSAALRPAFSYDYLLSHPYIVHLTAVRRELVIASGSFDARLPVSQDYDLLLRVAALTRKFHHVPKALYRWRIHGTSTGHRQAGLVMQISRAALQRHLRLVGGHAAGAWVEDGPVMNTFRVRYPVAPAKVAVVVVGGGTADARECLRAFWEQTRFPEGVVADVTVVAPPEKIGAELRRLEYRVVELASDSGLAAQLNAAAGQTQGEHLLFLDAGAIPADENWLQALIEPLAQPDVAAVGAKLVNPRTGLIEHAGAIVGFDGSVGMEHRGFPEKEGGLPFPGHGHGLAVIRDCSALSGACLMVRRRSFTAAGGFDPEYAGAFHDFDLALRLRAGGQRVVFTPYARLFWEGSAAPTGAELARFGARWSEAIRAGDPFYSPNLARAGKMFWPAD